MLQFCKIDFTTPSNKRKPLDTNTAAPITLKNHSQTTEPSEEELEMFYKQILFNYRRRSSLLSIIPGYCDQYIPKSESGILPKPLATFFSGCLYRQHILSCWKKVAKKIRNLGISKEEAKLDTRSQSHSKHWFQYRAGRITASNLKRVLQVPLNLFKVC